MWMGWFHFHHSNEVTQIDGMTWHNSNWIESSINNHIKNGRESSLFFFNRIRCQQNIIKIEISIVALFLRYPYQCLIFRFVTLPFSFIQRNKLDRWNDKLFLSCIVNGVNLRNNIFSYKRDRKWLLRFQALVSWWQVTRLSIPNSIIFLFYGSKLKWCFDHYIILDLMH